MTFLGSLSVRRHAHVSTLDVIFHIEVNRNRQSGSQNGIPTRKHWQQCAPSIHHHEHEGEREVHRGVRLPVLRRVVQIRESRQNRTGHLRRSVQGPREEEQQEVRRHEEGSDGQRKGGFPHHGAA